MSASLWPLSNESSFSAHQELTHSSSVSVGGGRERALHGSMMLPGFHAQGRGGCRAEAAALKGSLCMFQSLPCRAPPMMDLRNQVLRPLMLRARRQPKVGPLLSWLLPSDRHPCPPSPRALQPVLSHVCASPPASSAAFTLTGCEPHPLGVLCRMGLQDIAGTHVRPGAMRQGSLMESLCHSGHPPNMHTATLILPSEATRAQSSCLALAKGKGRSQFISGLDLVAFV